MNHLGTERVYFYKHERSESTTIQKYLTDIFYNVRGDWL